MFNLTRLQRIRFYSRTNYALNLLYEHSHLTLQPDTSAINITMIIDNQEVELNNRNYI